MRVIMRVIDSICVDRLRLRIVGRGRVIGSGREEVRVCV